MNIGKFALFMFISVLGSFVLAGFAIWALATKKDTLPKWGKIVLWLFVALAVILLIAGIFSVVVVLRNLI